MANFLIVVDGDARRRDRFCETAGPALAPLDGLRAGDCECGEFRALWASGARAPVTAQADHRTATVIWGRPITGDRGHVIGPSELASAWTPETDGALPVFDGYFAASRYDAECGLAVGADILGLFPIFWWSAEDVLLVGSSPEPFRNHPLFRSELDLDGLAGILLMGHCVNGRTLEKGVNRLAAGCVLQWRKGSPPRETMQYQLPMSSEHFSLPFSAAVERVHDVLRDSVARHVPPDTPCLLTLSGGRDSRLLAGVMVELGRAPVALTYGSRGDIELECATDVARALHLEHHTREMRLERYDAYAELHARLLHCCTGFNLIEYWSCVDALREHPPLFASAFIMDFVIGGSHVDWAYSRSGGDVSFANLLARNNASAMPLATLRQLLRPDVFGQRLDETIDRLKQTFDSYPGFTAQRAWCFDLYHRVRFHTAAFPWQLSFGSWPILPTVDRRVFEVTGGVPPGVLSERRVQDEIIRRYFPTLAALPIDRNSYDTTPISPRLRREIRDGVIRRLRPFTRRIPVRARRRERRIYYRVFDFNGAPWKAARAGAEPHRKKLYQLFDRQVLDTVLPPPDVEVPMKDGIIEASGRKLLVGLCYWAAKHL